MKLVVRLLITSGFLAGLGALLFNLYLTQVQVVSGLLPQEYELWRTIGAKQLALIDTPDSHFYKSLRQLVDTAEEYQAIDNQAYVHKRLDAWWVFQRELLPSSLRFESKPDAERVAIDAMRRQTEAALKDRLRDVNEKLCHPKDPAARDALTRLLALVEWSLTNEVYEATHARYQHIVTSASPCTADRAAQQRVPADRPRPAGSAGG